MPRESRSVTTVQRPIGITDECAQDDDHGRRTWDADRSDDRAGVIAHAVLPLSSTTMPSVIGSPWAVDAGSTTVA
jgi:hypothetical protein